MSAPRTNLISKTSLIGVVPQFSANVADNDFVAANDFANKRLKKLLPSALWTRMEAVSAFGTWAVGTAYVVGNEVVHNNRGYICIQNGTGQNPTTATTYWTEKEAYSVFRDYLKPFLCWQAYNHFLIYHGLFVSQGGIKKHIDLNAEQAPPEERSRAIKRAQEQADLIYMDFQKYMQDVSNTIDSIVYTFTDTAAFKPKIGIHMVKVIFLMLFASQVYGQAYPTPIVNEAKNYHFTKDVYIDGQFKVGYPTPTIARDIHFVADTIRLEGIDGSGSLLGIDINGDVTRVTGAGAGGVTGLNPTEVLYGSAGGGIGQDADFAYTEATGVLSITGSNSRLYLQNVAGTISNDIGYDGIYLGNSVTTYFSSLLPDRLQLGHGIVSTSLFRQTGGSSYNINLPNANGTSGQALRLNGGLNLEWYSPTSGTVTSIATTSPIGGGTITTTGTLNLLASAADKYLYSTGLNTWTEGSITSYTRSFLTAVSANAALTELGIPTLAGEILYGDGTGIVSDGHLSYNGTTDILDINRLQFDGGNGYITEYEAATATDGQLFVGQTSSGAWKTGGITSSDITVGYSSPNITLDYASGSIASGDLAGSIDATKIADGSVTSTEFQYINTLTSNAQTQLDSKTAGVGTAVHLTGQNAAIAATTAYTTPAADGMYQINWVVTVTTAATTSSQVAFQFKFTNAADNVVKTFPATGVNSITQSNANTTGTVISGTGTMYCKASTNIQYVTAYTSSGATAMQYSLDIQIVKL